MSDDRMQIHENTMVKRLALEYGVDRDQVINQGQVADRLNRVTICGACRVRQANTEDYENRPIPYRVEFSVRLEPKLRVLDNQLFLVYWVLAGQCQDCGLVYFVWWLDTDRGRS